MLSEPLIGAFQRVWLEIRLVKLKISLPSWSESVRVRLGIRLVKLKLGDLFVFAADTSQ